MTNRLAVVREQRGWSASLLAQAVGVSRQTIYAVEAGSYMPNTETGLKLARALGVRVDELFSLPDEAKPRERYERAMLVPLEEPLQQGQAVQLGKVNGKLVAAAVEPTAWCLPASDGVWDGAGRVRVYQQEAEFGNRVMLAGCDPAMGRVARYLESTGVELILLHQNSSLSLKLLKGGYAHVAGCHLGDSNIETVNRLFPAKSAVVFSFAVWQEGLVTAAGNPKDIRSVADLTRRDVSIVNREEGAGSRTLLDRHLKRLGMSSKRVHGYQSNVAGHLAGALEVKKGAADCCMSTEAAARFFGLAFVALESVRYDLVIRKQQLGTPGIQALLDSMSQLRFRRMLSSVGGYDTSVTGNRIM